MAIVSSTHTLGSAQIDGRRYVTEDHIDDIGKHWLVEYLAASDADYVSIRAARAAVIAVTLVVTEIAASLSVDATPTLVYASKNDYVPILREAYRSASRVECARLATWILNRLDAGWVTDAQLRTAFDLTAGQWATLKAKMTTLRTNWLAVQAAAGE